VYYLRGKSRIEEIICKFFISYILTIKKHIVLIKVITFNFLRFKDSTNISTLKQIDKRFRLVEYLI